MKTRTGILAVAALAGLCYALPSQAQGIPGGSYTRSCGNARVEGDRLVANCRAADGRTVTSALPDVRRCVGDIGNNNGQLNCSYAGGGHSPEGYGAAPPPPPPVYGGRPGYGAPGYGAPPPPPGYGQAGPDCEGLHREARELRYRLDQPMPPDEHYRVQQQLERVQRDEYRCGR